MQIKIKKWGNSLGIRIPKSIAQKLNLTDSSEVQLNTDYQKIIISKSESELDQILDKINLSNSHSEKLEDDQIIGNETW